MGLDKGDLYLDIGSQIYKTGSYNKKKFDFQLVINHFYGRLFWLSTSNELVVNDERVNNNCIPY